MSLKQDYSFNQQNLNNTINKYTPQERAQIELYLRGFSEYEKLYINIMNKINTIQKYKNTTNLKSYQFTYIKIPLDTILYKYTFVDNITEKALLLYFASIHPQTDSPADILKYFNKYITYWSNSQFSKAVFEFILDYVNNNSEINLDMQTLLEKLNYMINKNNYYSEGKKTKILDILNKKKHNICLRYWINTFNNDKASGIFNITKYLIKNETNMKNTSKIEFFYTLYILYNSLNITDISNIYYQKYIQLYNICYSSLSKEEKIIKYKKTKIIYKKGNSITYIGKKVKESLSEIYKYITI